MRLLIAFLLCMFAFSAEADDETVIISGTEITGLFDSKMPGPYDNVYTYLTEGFASVKLIREPIRRAQRGFFKQESDCLFVGSAVEDFYLLRGMPKDKLLMSNGVNQVTLRVFTRPGEPVIENLNALKGKVIAVDSGAGTSTNFYDRYFSREVQILSTEKLEQAFLLLKQKRVVAVVAFDLDVNLLLKRQPSAALYEFSENFMLDRNEDAIVCWRSAKTERFIEHINKRLNEMHKEGTMQALLYSSARMLSR